MIRKTMDRETKRHYKRLRSKYEAKSDVDAASRSVAQTASNQRHFQRKFKCFMLDQTSNNAPGRAAGLESI